MIVNAVMAFWLIVILIGIERRMYSDNTLPMVGHVALGIMVYAIWLLVVVVLLAVTTERQTLVEERHSSGPNANAASYPGSADALWKR